MVENEDLWVGAPSGVPTHRFRRQKRGILQFVVRRIALLIVQVWGIVTVVFVLLKFLPGNPRYLLAGPLATTQQINAITKQLGLNQPAIIQYLKYMWQLLHGNFGTSFFSQTPVLQQIETRFPATLELVTASFILILVLAIPLGVISAVSRHARKPIFLYGMVSGALPDFWWGLIVILVLYVHFHLGPAPVGQLGLLVTPPPTVTGLLTVDSVIAGDWQAFVSAVAHLVLPAITLAFVYGGQILKLTRSKVIVAMDSDYVRYARACGLPPRQVYIYALRNGLVPVLTLSGMTYCFLISGAVIIETIFSWGGMGQYAVQAITNSDYFAITGSVIVFATFSLIVYVVMDILYAIVDPRVRYGRGAGGE